LLGCGLSFGTIDAVPDGAVSVDDASSPLADTGAPRADASTSDGAEVDAAPLPCTNGVRDGDETDVDCGGTTCGACAVGQACVASADCQRAVCGPTKTCALAQSCKELLAGHPGLADGVYKLANRARTGEYDVGCDMTHEGGGFTLLMKVDGTRGTFAFGAPYWTTAALLATDRPSLTERVEAKLPSYHEVSLDEVMLVFDVNGLRRLRIPAAGATSLGALITSGRTVTNLGREKWLAFMPDSTLQPNCNAEGFSIEEGVRLRIGILGNDVAGCGQPDSFIGVGSDEVCSRGTRAGNVICFNGFGNDRDRPVFAWIYAR